jgi:DNA-binding transcriptional LysR family regulator
MARRLPSLNGLRAFEAAGRQGSFTAAAQELNVTQAAVSRLVRLLEGRLGFALFRRHGCATSFGSAPREPDLRYSHAQ